MSCHTRVGANSVAAPHGEGANVAQEETPVLVVGGSLVGLTSALLLGDLGVPSLVVERHPGTAIHDSYTFSPDSRPVTPGSGRRLTGCQAGAR